MGATEQVNVRVPSPARELILRIASRLRDDNLFAGRLERWLAEQSDPTAGPLLTERVERLERRVDALEAGRGSVRVATSTPQANPSAPQVAPTEPPNLNLFGEEVVDTPDPVWTSGKGRGRRLTPEGEAEIERRIRAGQPDSEIAKAMGVQPFTVANRRKKLDEQSV